MLGPGIWAWGIDVELAGKVHGDKEVLRALGLAPRLFLRYLRAWLKDERARFVGGPDSKGRKRKGYRAILSNKRRRRRSGTWPTQVTHLFKGYVPDHPTRIGDLFMRAGAGLRHPNRMTRALELLASGGTISSSKSMIIPMYKNLAAIGIGRGYFKAFRRLISQDRLVGIRKGGKVLYFDETQRTKTGRLSRAGLMYMGLRGVRVRAQLTGRYDFLARWNRMQPTMINRGQRVVDRAVEAVDRGRLS